MPDDALPLVWVGALEDVSGYADEARAFLVALERTGRPVAAHGLRWTDDLVALPESQRRAVDAATGRPHPRPRVTVYHLVPGKRVVLDDAGPNVIRTMFESDRVPQAWLQRLAEVDEVWVPCMFNLETFARGGVDPDRLHVLPETIDFELFRPTTTTAAPGRPFTFLTTFDFTDRKGWDLLLDAWAEAFEPDAPVRLLLKCNSIHGLPAATIRKRVEHRLGERPTAPVELDLRLLAASEMPALYAGADAFVLASRGEGWGRPFMEAMAMGLPTIGSRWSGNLDFMDDGNSWLVDGEVVPVPDTAQTHTQLYRGHRWFEPDRDALVAALREVAAGGPAVAARAAAARPGLVARFGPEQVATRFAELTEAALERWSARRARPLRCVWRGDWGSIHSLAVVNEATTRALDGAGVRVRRRATDALEPVPDDDVGVAQQWPPDFEAPTEGPFVLYQPWEFGEIPAAWVEQIRHRVDEVWTPSEYSRSAFLAAGVAPELVHVVPNGVDLARFRPDGDRWELERRAGTVFLFVGGTTYRKGIDVLLDAYGRAFTADDDVLLVLKGVGAATFYRGQTADEPIARFRARTGAPALLTLDDELPYELVPALYRAADCVVQPYRGEGFCLPALEALACGRALIATAGGPTDDFASDACAWRLPSRRAPLPPGALPAALAPAGGGFLLEPDADALVAALRAATDPAARAAKAARAREHAERFGWPAAAQRAAERLEALLAAAPIRNVAPARVADARALVLAADVDWDEPETWGPALTAYASAFGPDDDTTLVLPTHDEAHALAQVGAHLARLDVAADTLADVVLADASALAPAALELAADAFVHSTGPRPLRARRVVPPDVPALRSLLQS